MSNDDFNPISNIFTYFMIMFSFFLIGFIFLLINGPLLIDSLNENTSPDINHVVYNSIIQKWKDFQEKNFDGNFLIFYSSLALIMGLIIKSISNIFVMIPVILEKIIRSIFPKFPKSFNPIKFFEYNFIKSIVSLNESNSIKLHWEWEMFNYYLHWGIFTNFIISAILLYTLIKPPNFPFIYILFLLYLFLFGWIRSIVLQAFYKDI